MNVNDFYLAATKAKVNYKRGWVMRAFSVFTDRPDAKVYPFALARDLSGYFFYDESLQKVKIEGADPALPLLRPDTVIQVPANYFEYWPVGGATTAGNLLFNSICMWPSVGARFGYYNERVNVGKIENLFTSMVDTPPADAVRDPKVVYVDDYLRFCNAVNYLQEFTQLFTVALTEKATTPPPGLAEKKAEILAKYKDAGLNDPLVQTKIYKELIEFDAEYLKGDPSEKFLISDKSRETVRRKLYLIMGGEAGLEASHEIKLTANSLSQGWEVDAIPDYINNTRAGTFSRGTETRDGGVVFKWLMKATSSMGIGMEDCGSTHTMTKRINDGNKESIRSLYALDDTNKPILIDDPQAYVGKYVRLRLPHKCLVQGTNFCRVCLGKKLSANENAISLAATSYGGGFLNMKLKAMHGKAHKAAIVTLEEVIS